MITHRRSQAFGSESCAVPMVDCRCSKQPADTSFVSLFVVEEEYRKVLTGVRVLERSNAKPTSSSPVCCYERGRDDLNGIKCPFG